MSDLFQFFKHYTSVAVFLVILISVLLIWIIFLHLKIRSLTSRDKKFFGRHLKGELKDLLEEYSKRISKSEDNIKELFDILKDMNGILIKSIQKIGIVRYNPFGEGGGDQSFSIALLDQNNDGLIISSLHSRDTTRIYGKPLKRGKSSYRLTDEEKEAIRRATG